MQIEDAIYGGFSIEEPLILDVLKSRLFGKLKKMSIHGPLHKNGHFKKRFVSVYEHALGNYYLSKRLNLNKQQQCFVLLLPSRPFLSGHGCLSYLYNLNKNMYNADQYTKPLQRVIGKKILSYKEASFEKSWPTLTVSRLDLLLRDYALYDRFDICHILDDLQFEDGKLIFQDPYIAKEVGYMAFKLSNLFWGSPFVSLLSHYYEEAHTYVRKNRFLREKIFALPYYEQYQKIQSLKHPHVKRKLKKFKSCRPDHLILTDTEYDISLDPIFRYVDPYIREDEQIKRLSEFDADYQEDINQFIQSQRKIFIQSL